MKQPFYIRLSYILLSVLLISFILYRGKDVVVPLVFSTLLAIFLLRPVTYLQERKWCPRPLAIVLPLIVALSAIAGMVYFFYTQFAFFAEDFPVLKERLLEQIAMAQQWIKEKMNLSLSDQNQYVNDMLDRMKESGMIGKTFLSITAGLALVVLIPVFTYLLLYYKDLITQFFIDLFSNNERRVKDVFHESHLIIQSYLGGLILEMIVVIVLNIIGLSLVGVKYAILLAIFAGVLNLIPYLGMISATIFAALITLVTAENSIDVVWVAVTLGSVQLIDNYLILPLVVGSKVQINVLATILGVLVGGALMGVPGMFLAIPTIAVFKVICDRVEGLKPWGALLGNHVTGERKLKWALLQKWNPFGKHRKRVRTRAHSS